MQAKSLHLIYDILAREASSLLSYLSGAWPWSSSKERDSARQLQSLVDDEMQAQRRLGETLRKHRMIPPSARFPMSFTTLHFLALDYLLPKVLNEQQALLVQLEKDQTQLDEAGKEALEPFLAMKQQHLEQLTNLTAAHSGSKAVSTIK